MVKKAEAKSHWDEAGCLPGKLGAASPWSNRVALAVGRPSGPLNPGRGIRVLPVR
jgi:hypothetical protein